MLATTIPLLSACAVFDGLDDEPRATLSVLEASAPGAEPRGVEPIAGGMRVRGVVSTPCLGYSLSANVDGLRGAVDVTIRARQTSEVCQTAIGQFAYAVDVAGVAAGTTRVRVRHEVDAAPWASGTVVDTVLVVLRR